MPNSRRKGVSGEREVRRLLEARGIPLRWHDYEAQRYGGEKGDILIPDLWALEVKRRSGGAFSDAWWRQACEAAELYGVRPAVAYRFDRRPWLVAWMVSDLLAHSDLEAWLDSAQFWWRQCAA